MLNRQLAQQRVAGPPPLLPLPPSRKCCRIVRPHCQRLRTTMAAAVVGEEAVSYEWSWQQARSQLPEQPSAFDADHQLPAQPSTQDILLLLQAAAVPASDSQQQQPSQVWMADLLASSQPLLQQLAAGDACQMCQHLSLIDYAPEVQWMQQLLQVVCLQAGQLSTQQLADLLWSLSNLRHTLEQQHWSSILQATAAKLQEFYGPDLARLLCAAGSIYSSSNTGVKLGPEAAVDGTAEPAAVSEVAAVSCGLSLPDGWADAVSAEVEYQVVEFVGDLGAFDLARLASGLADLGITPSSRLQEALLRAVYMRTRSIEEKGAVDFALAKLDAKGKRSMHYDPRWTHEELKWLPRRERDKRRILKEGWYRTQWTGWQQ